MIDFKIDVEKNEIELESKFNSVEHFADEMILMINTIVNVTAYHGTNGDFEQGKHFASQLKQVIAEVLDRDNEFEQFYRDQKSSK